MTLSDLIRRFRVLADDKVAPYLWADEDITDWLNDAQVQACVRGRLLLEDADPTMCEVGIEAGRHTYPLHTKLYELVRLSFKTAGGSCSAELKLVSRGWLDERFPRWRDDNRATGYAIQGEKSIRLVGNPSSAGVLTIEAYRLPLESMEDLDDEPEIHEASHEYLIHWALHKAFSTPDAETFDSARSAKSEAIFTAYFGLMTDSDMRRITREDTDHTNRVHL